MIVGVDPAALRELIELDGGFTVDLRSGQSVLCGISVCTRPSSSLVFSWADWDDIGVTTWLCGSAQLAPATCYLGGWLDPRTQEVWLDLVSVVAPAFRHEAFALARTMRQHGVFDLERMELVDLRVSAA
ncbi:MAG: hypothetical protein ABIR68_01450 [Ilumatobacteraceae bacterium]